VTRDELRTLKKAVNSLNCRSRPFALTDKTWLDELRTVKTTAENILEDLAAAARTRTNPNLNG
jgi:hypothetical protein